MNQESNSSVASLLNKNILITRPIGRELALRQQLEQAGCKIVHYPVITITPPDKSHIENIEALSNNVNNYSVAIFISPTAVEQSLQYFPALPASLKIISIGSKTTQILQDNNYTVDIEAPEHNSESLLQTEFFLSEKIKQQQFLIFRGNGGRALLGDTLIERGATVRYVETYNRELPSSQPLTISQLANIDAITISSSNGLQNLIQLTESLKTLISIPIVVPSKHTEQLAKQHNFKTIILADDATDNAMVAALQAYFSNKK